MQSQPNNYSLVELIDVDYAVEDQLDLSAVRLRYMEPSDAQALFFMENDPHNWFYSDRSDAPFSMTEIERFVNHSPRDLQTDGQLRFIVEVDGMIVGTVDLYDYDALDNTSWVGILIYPTEFRGRGIGGRVIEILSDICQYRFALKGVYACVSNDNLRSSKLFERCGFKLCDADSVLPVLEASAGSKRLTKQKIYYRGFSA